MPKKILYAKYLKTYIESRKRKPQEKEAEKIVANFYKSDPMSIDMFVKTISNNNVLTDKEIVIENKINLKDLDYIIRMYYYYLVPGHVFYYDKRELIAFLNDIITYGEIKDSYNSWKYPPRGHWKNKNRSRTYLSKPNPRKWKTIPNK